ncbi:uncharacterized protein LOC105422980 [Pogonomyrmex barbatus]|uniref:Uncharacterized protein LOC105422980 n=1 Tax=Pogonomyrmex barbatus TaxID=144034 RepID=A0A6I9VSV4_9HYME|nr:uncharacterized protein LOC105422980 [Pogonomyrmex barbatus]XP_011630888.1 uncharacterized protein LOC105422980 [Pogonomyrmex barbatus]
MGLKWFRARLSMKKEASKIPAMSGLYRRISYFESATRKNIEISTMSPSIASDSATTDNNETAQYDRSKADFTNQSSSSIIDLEKTMVKDNDKKSQINNHAIENIESSTSTEDLNIKEQSTYSEKSNKITKDQNNISDIKSPICADNELVI